MARGERVIYQATFFDGTWVGHADFLRRVDEPLDGCRWDWHYEVEDTKLARHTEPYFLLQLCYYSEHVARVQAASPRFMYVVLGDGQRQRFRVDDFAAYFRSVRDRFTHSLHANEATYPLKVDHCKLCAWDARVRRASPARRSPQRRRRHHAAPDRPPERGRHHDPRPIGDRAR